MTTKFQSSCAIALISGITVLTGCGKPDIPQLTSPSSATAPSSAAGATPAPPPPPEKATVSNATPTASSPAANRNDPKRIEHALELMNARLESYYYVNQQFPKNMADFEAWRHPNLALGELDPWPDPPTGKKWVLNPRGLVELGKAN